MRKTAQIRFKLVILVILARVFIVIRGTVSPIWEQPLVHRDCPTTNLLWNFIFHQRCLAGKPLNFENIMMKPKNNTWDRTLTRKVWQKTCARAGTGPWFHWFWEKMSVTLELWFTVKPLNLSKWTHTISHKLSKWTPLTQIVSKIRLEKD